MECVDELHMGQGCGEIFGQHVAFPRSSKHSSHIEGMCLLVKWIVGQGQIVVSQLYIDSWAMAVGFEYSRES